MKKTIIEFVLGSSMKNKSNREAQTVQAACNPLLLPWMMTTMRIERKQHQEELGRMKEGKVQLGSQNLLHEELRMAPAAL